MWLLFFSWLCDDLQVVVICLFFDEWVFVDVLVVMGVLIVMLFVGIFFNGFMVVVWVGLFGDDFVFNLSYWEIEWGDLDLVVVGIFDGVVMVEVGVNQLFE